MSACTTYLLYAKKVVTEACGRLMLGLQLGDAVSAVPQENRFHGHLIARGGHVHGGAAARVGGRSQLRTGLHQAADSGRHVVRGVLALDLDEVEPQHVFLLGQEGLGELFVAQNKLRLFLWALKI